MGWHLDYIEITQVSPYAIQYTSSLHHFLFVSRYLFFFASLLHTYTNLLARIHHFRRSVVTVVNVTHFSFWLPQDVLHKCDIHPIDLQLRLSENEGSECGTSSARVHYVWVACGESFSTCKGEDAEIHRALEQTYEKNCIDISNVQRWKRNFENNHCISLVDERLSGQPSDCLTVDNICHVCEILKADDHSTLDKIVVYATCRMWMVNHTCNQSQCVAVTNTRLLVGTLHSH